MYPSMCFYILESKLRVNLQIEHMKLIFKHARFTFLDITFFRFFVFFCQQTFMNYEVE